MLGLYEQVLSSLPPAAHLMLFHTSHQSSRRHEPGFSVRQLSLKILITELHVPENITAQLPNRQAGGLFNSEVKLEEGKQCEIRFFF